MSLAPEPILLGGASLHGRTPARRWPAVVRYVVGIALGLLALWALDGQRGELSGAIAALGDLNTEWVCLAIAVEVGSLVAFAGLQRRLLRCGQLKVGMLWCTAMTFAAGAIASSLPAGPAVSSVYAFRQYRRHGADAGLAGWTIAATFGLASLGLALLAAAGVAMAERQGASDDLIGVTAGVLVLAILAVALLAQRRVLQWCVRTGLSGSRRVIGRPRAGFNVEHLVERVTSIPLRPRAVAATTLWSIASWSLDCACLALSFSAIGAPIPWRGLLLAYGASQLAANLPITPGGLGVVEGSLTIALVAFGGVEPTTVAAVLLYRIISFWGYLPVGWLAWAAVAMNDRRQDRRLACQAATIEPAPPRSAGLTSSIGAHVGCP
jgi:uncharacterized protein (TIRG00374 family)